MKKIKLSILVGLIVCTAQADWMRNEEELTLAPSNFIVIPLGLNCDPALALRENKMRHCAFPFDWCITPYQALYDFISNDFENYFKKENLVPAVTSCFTPREQIFLQKMNYRHINPDWVLDKEFGTFYPHDFPDNDFTTISKLHESRHAKYRRRIERLYNEIHSGKTVYFVRFLNITTAEAYELYAVLNQKFPTIDVRLIAIGNSPEFNQDANIPAIKFLFIPKDEECWQPNSPFWKKLCDDITQGVFY